MEEGKDIDLKQAMEVTILNAAEELFTEKGFNGVSTTEIALKAGCNQALIHYYYRTKANLFQKVFENKLRYLISIFNIPKDNTLSFEDNLRFRIESHFDALAQNPRLPMFILNEVKNNLLTGDIIRQSFKDNIPNLISNFEDELSEEIKLGRIRDISAFDLMINITSLNIFPFLSLPIIEFFFTLDKEKTQIMFASRKKEIVDTILNSIRIVKE